MPDWVEKSLGSVFKVKHGFAFKGEYFTDSPQRYALVTPGNFSIGGGFQSQKHKYYSGPVPDEYVLQPGAVVVTMTDLSKESDTLGYAALVPDDGTTWLHNQRVGLLQFHEPDQSDPVFFGYLMRTQAYRAWVVGSATGTTVKHTAPSRIESFRCPMPPVEEQRQISVVLKALDDKIAVNRHINQTLEAIAQAIFKSWFADFDPVKAKIAAKAEGRDPLRAAMTAISGKPDAELNTQPPEQFAPLAATAALFPDEMEDSELGEIPKGWSASNFGAVSSCFDRLRIPLSSREREKRQGTVPYYGATSVMDHVDEAIFDGIYLLLGEDGSVLKPDGTPFVQYIWGKSWVNNHAHVLQGTNGVSTEQLMLFISTQNISAFVTGAVQLKLNQKNMNSIPFIKASLETNERFIELISPFFAKHRALVEETRSLTELRDSLLPKLLSGELRVQDFENEAAT